MCDLTASFSCEQYTEVVRIALVGKYVRVQDAYASVIKALRHSAVHAERKLEIQVTLD